MAFPSSHSIAFVLNDEVMRIPEPSPTMTVLQYLREVARRCGTKEGCAEGDCGACTVVLGELSDDGAAIDYRAINACIRFLPTIDGKELVTVESLRDPAAGAAAEPHPVQRAMVECHGSQCGFCTPGFVMSLFALYQSASSADRDKVVDSIAGNLCRCTGYRPIIKAGQTMFAQAEPARWSRSDAQAAPRRQRLASLVRERSRGESLRYAGFHAPRSVDELAQSLATDPQAVLLAGGTDVGLWVTQQLRQLPPIVYLGEVPELAHIRRGTHSLWIGAAVTLARAWPALLAVYPQLAEQAQRFASPPIRNSATLCGNLANGSPIGDCLPALLALDAQLELRRGEHTRVLPLAQFYLDYQKKALAVGEFIVGVEVPLGFTDQLIASYKVAKRHDQDISAVCASFRIALRDGLVSELRLAYGGMAATARRAAAAEAALLGKPWRRDSINAARAALSQDFTPLSDVRASNDYRLAVAGNLLLRFFLHSQGEATALPAAPVA